MTRASLREYAAVQRERYPAATAGREERRCWTRSSPSPGCIARPPSGCCAARRGPDGPIARRPAAALRARGRRGGEVLWQASGPHRRRIASIPSCPNCSTASRATGTRAAPRSTSSSGRSVAPPSPGCSPPRAARVPRRGATTTRPSTWLTARDPHSHLRRVGRCAAPGFSEVDLVAHCGSRHPGFLPLHPLRRRHRHRLGRAGGRLGQGAGPRRRRRPSRPRSACRCPWLGLDSDNGSRVHQPAASTTTAGRAHHLHPQPRLEEERQRARRAEERRHRPPPRRL